MSRARILADYVAGGTTAAEFDVLDGLTSTTAELNYVDGVTSNVQTQMNDKAPKASPTFTGTVAIPNVANLETAVVANTAKVTNATHTGDVTGGTTLTIADDAVTGGKLANDIAISTTGTMNITNIQARSGNPIYLKDEGGTTSLTITDDGYTGISGSTNTSLTTASTVIKGALKVGVGNKDASGWVGHGYLMSDESTGWPTDTTARILKENTGSDGSLYLVSGQGGGASDGRFTDLVLYSGSSAPVILHSLEQSSPETRVYSKSGETFKLRFDSSDSNTWNQIGWTGIGGNERRRDQGNNMGG